MMIFLPAELGRYVYRFATSAEAKLYGLEKTQVDIGEMVMSIHRTPIEDRETILMLHGFSSDKVIWSRFAKHFTDDYNVIIPDMAGHGDTGFSKNWNYGAKAQVDRLIQLLDELKISKVHVIGNSMGGFFSAHMAIRYPERLLSTAFIDPAGVTSSIASDLERMVKSGHNPFIVNSRQEFDKFYAMTMAKPPWLPDFVLQAVSEKYQNRSEQLAQIFSDFHQKDMLDESLDQIKLDTLLLWGEKDQLLHISSVDAWQAGIPNIKVKTWEDIGHMPMLEIPVESAAVYREFLER